MFPSLRGITKAFAAMPVVVASVPVRNYTVPKRKMIRKEYFVYKPKMKSRYKGNPYPRLRMLLLEDVDHIGMKGDIVEVKRGLARNKLIPNRLGVYATEENLVTCGIDPERLKEDNTPKVPLNVLKYLQKHRITLQSPDGLIQDKDEEQIQRSWFITLHDICAYFDRGALLKVPVTCMNIIACHDNVIRETGEYTVQVTLNKIVTVDVPLIVTDNTNLLTM